MTEKELIDQIQKAESAYRIGDPIMNDLSFDSLVEKYRKQFPDGELFKDAVIAKAPTDRMERLPIPMFSLEKVTTVKDLLKWIKAVWKIAPAEKVVITPKYDGISLCVNEATGEAWTRGDGVKGQKSNEWYARMDKGTRTGVIEKSEPVYSFGEAILTHVGFEKLNKDKKYSNARNLVAGIFNASSPSDKVDMVHYVRYGVDETSLPYYLQEDKSTKESQLKFLKYIVNDAVVTTKEIVIGAFFLQNSEEEILNFLSDCFRESIATYKCDGLVLEVNSAEKRNELGRLSNGNPKYAIAFKLPEWVEAAETTVTGIEIGVSKDGVFNPVANYEPFVINGVTLTRASLFNAKYLFENKVATGSRIVVTRSGDVIPYHVRTVSHDTDETDALMNELLDHCPCCGSKPVWDETHTNLVCINPNCPEKVENEILFFFDTMKFKGIKLPTIKKLIEGGLDDLSLILGNAGRYVSRDRYADIIGEAKARVLCEHVNRIKVNEGVSMATYCTAMNFFKGVIGEKTCQSILNQLTDMQIFSLRNICDKKLKDWEFLLEMKGVQETTATVFLNGFNLYATTPCRVKISKVIEVEPEMKEGSNIFLFSGFRDSELKQKLELSGNRVVSDMSKEVTVLVVKDLDSESSKMKKAREYGIEIITKEKTIEKWL